MGNKQESWGRRREKDLKAIKTTKMRKGGQKTEIGTSTTCVAAAAGFYFAGAQPGLVSPCDSTCQECQGAAAVCTVCKPPLFPASTLPGPCTSICDVTCASCSVSAILCDTCKTGYLLRHRALPAALNAILLA